MNKEQKKIHSKEIENRKAKQKERIGNYYIQYSNKSANGVEYTNMASLDTFGKLRFRSIDNQGWFYLVNLAKDKLVNGVGGI